MMKFFCLAVLASAALSSASEILIEAESFPQRGGWKTDTQFIETMGSPYLNAHGLGFPVADARAPLSIAEAGDYKVWVRTRDWSEALGRDGGAGTFSLLIDGKTVGGALGAGSSAWGWEEAGTATLTAGTHELALHDHTGFNARVDAVLLSSTPGFVPENDSAPMAPWREFSEPVTLDGYDLVVVGGGYGGLGSAISAARMGCKVALIQNRAVLGGNGSSEIRVWAMGDLPPSEYKLADIITEIMDEASASPAPGGEFRDLQKAQVVAAEENIDLFLSHHAYGVTKEGDAISGVKVFDIYTGQTKVFEGTFYADCTGHGFLGLWAGADRHMEEGGRMGMSNMWAWENTPTAAAFPGKPWMLPLEEGQFPYPKKFHAQWFWEGGFDNHPIDELEKTRDHNLLASYSAWSAIKNHKAYAERDPAELGHTNSRLTWMAYIGGTRETLQLLGDVVLKEKDILEKTEFPDGCVLTTWSIDLHIPSPEYAKYHGDQPFISKAIHNRAIDKKIGYPIPYRTFYSRSVPNLFMAGRNISVDRGALGTIRVMKTIGMMGVVVGRAAALATAHDCSPRELYHDHLEELKASWKLPGTARFASPEDFTKATDVKP